jgi:signal transduction histidine kinase
MTGSPGKLRILLVDDNPYDLAIYRRLIRKGVNAAHECAEARCGQAAMESCRFDPPDCVLLDYLLPDLDGLDVLRRLGEGPATASVPVVMITGQGNEAIAVEAMKRGAQDYLIKDHLTPEALERAINNAIEKGSLRRKLGEKQSEIEQFTFAITHDLQTPMASLTGAVDALRQTLNGLEPEGAGLWLARIEAANCRLVNMLDDLMTYAKAGREKLELVPVALQEVLRQVEEEVAGLAAEGGTRLHVEPTSATVVADRGGLFRVFENLIVNAIKFNDKGGDGAVRVTVEEHEGVVTVRIADNGPGIPVTQIDRVFLPFKRACANKPGSGLGLSVVKRYTEAFGGRVWLESDGSRGTTAFVELPAAPPEEDQA